MLGACLKFRVAFGTEISRCSLDGRWIKEMVLLSPNVKDSHFKTSWFKIGLGCVKRFMHPFGSSLSCPEQFSTSVSEWFGGAAKPQDETKVFICGSAVFEGEAVCLGLEGSGVGERERMGLENLLQHNGGSSEKPLLHLQLAALEVWATSLKLWLNCWCSSGEWGYKTKITFVEEESERNFIEDKSTLGWTRFGPEMGRFGIILD